MCNKATEERRLARHRRVPGAGDARGVARVPELAPALWGRARRGRRHRGPGV